MSTQRPTMKILITGATGGIGGEVVHHCLSNPVVTSVVALTRRELPGDIARHEKLECLIVEDFAKWPERTLESIKDADAMIWMMGTFDGNPAVNLEYPMAFQESFVKYFEARPRRPRFRYIHLSGRLTEQDQTKPLCLKSEARKIKGVFEVEALKFAEQHIGLWQTFLVRPGGVLPKDSIATSVLGLVMGRNWSVRAEELGAYMADLAVRGDEDGNIIENERIVSKGRELLKAACAHTPAQRGDTRSP